MPLPSLQRPDLAYHLLRFTLALVFLSHGITRAVTGKVEPFGTFLQSQGFPEGVLWAWGVTLWEIVGATLLVAGRWVPAVAIVFALEVATGIALVHWMPGWFVVGHGTNGMEFSVVLIAALLSLLFVSRR